MVGETIATLISSEIKCFFFQFPTYNERRLVLAKYLRISKKRKRKKEKKYQDVWETTMETCSGICIF
jgi:siroheme synthase (precorrin-2 oxidase/ferrochelatase)